MKDIKKQYDHDTTGVMMPVDIAESKTSADLKIKSLEDQLGEQGRELLKLRRDIIRLKNQIDDVINMVRNRG